MKKRRTIVPALFSLFVLSSSYAADVSITGETVKKLNVKNSLGETPSYTFVYGLNNWRIGFTSPITFRNYAPVLDTTTSLSNAMSQINTNFGTTFSQESVPWNQGPYLNRLAFSSVGAWDAVSLPYVIRTDGTTLECVPNTTTVFNNSGSTYGVFVNNLSGSNGVNGACGGERINFAHIVFNSSNISNASTTDQTHLVLHEVSHLFGLGHIETATVGDDTHRLCDSIMIEARSLTQNTNKCTNAAPTTQPLAVFGVRDLNALNFLLTH